MEQSCRPKPHPLRLGGCGHPLLYLDFDGVLHPDQVWWSPRRGVYLENCPGHELFEHAAALEGLLAPHPRILIVLSTSWVRRFGYAGAARRLPPGLRSRVVGATFHTSMDEPAFLAKSRGLQITEDVARRRPSDWIAIDDDAEGWPDDSIAHLVRSDPDAGLVHPDVLSRLATGLARLDLALPLA